MEGTAYAKAQGSERAWRVKPCPSVHQPTWNTEHLLCARRFPGPGPAAEPRIWASADRQDTLVLGGPRLPGCALGLCSFHEAAMCSWAKQDRAFFGPCQLSREKLPNFYRSRFPTTSKWFATSPAAPAFQDRRCQDKGWPRNALLLPRHIKGPVDGPWPRVSVSHSEVVEKEEAGSQCALEDSGLTWCPPGESSSCLERSLCPGPPSSGLKKFSCSWYQPRAHLLREAPPRAPALAGARSTPGSRGS